MRIADLLRLISGTERWWLAAGTKPARKRNVIGVGDKEAVYFSVRASVDICGGKGFSDIFCDNSHTVTN